MLTVAIPKRNKLQNIIVLTPKDGPLLSMPALVLFFELFLDFHVFYVFLYFFQKKC